MLFLKFDNLGLQVADIVHVTFVLNQNCFQLLQVIPGLHMCLMKLIRQIDYPAFLVRLPFTIADKLSFQLILALCKLFADKLQLRRALTVVDQTLVKILFGLLVIF